MLAVVGVNLHADHGIDGFSEGEPPFCCHGGAAGHESLAYEILPRLAGNTTSKHPTRWHNGKDEGCGHRYDELNNPGNEGSRLVPRSTFCTRYVNAQTGCGTKCGQEEGEVTDKVGVGA